MLTKWDYRFLREAQFVANWSKDGSKIGAILVRPDKTVSSQGFNCLPPKMNDKVHLKDRNWKNQCILHAEENAILSSKDSSLEGFTIYVWGLYPCAHCAAIIAKKNIKKVVSVSAIETTNSEHWKQSNEIADVVFKECDVEQIKLEFNADWILGEENANKNREST